MEPALQKRFGRNLALLSVGMLLNMASYRTLEALQSTLNRGVGVSSLATIYTSTMISALFLPPLLIERFKCRMCLIVSPLGYAIYTAANFYPTPYTLLPAGLLLGLSSSTLWSSAMVYIIDLSRKRCKFSHQNLTAVTGNNFGIFFGIVNLSIVFGTILVSAILAIAAVGSSNDFQPSATESPTSVKVSTETFQTIDNHPKSYQTPSTSYNDTALVCGLYYKISATHSSVVLNPVVLYTMYALFLTLNLVTSLFHLCLDDISHDNESSYRPDAENRVVETSVNQTDTVEQCPLTEIEQPNKYVSSVKSVLKLVTTDKITFLLAFITIHLGMVQAFSRGDYNAAWVSCTKGIEHTTYVMLCYGVVLSLGSFIAGCILHYLTHIYLFASATILELALLIVLLKWQPVASDTFMIYAVACLLAFSDGIFKSQLPGAYNLIFPKSKDSAATIQILWQSIGSASLYLISVATQPVASVSTVLIALLVGYFSFVIGYRMQNNRYRYWEQSKK